MMLSVSGPSSESLRAVPPFSCFPFALTLFPVRRIHSMQPRTDRAGRASHGGQSEGISYPPLAGSQDGARTDAPRPEGALAADRTEVRPLRHRHGPPRSSVAPIVDCDHDE